MAYDSVLNTISSLKTKNSICMCEVIQAKSHPLHLEQCQRLPVCIDTDELASNGAPKAMSLKTKNSIHVFI